MHVVVEEIWYFLEGGAHAWRKQDDHEEVVDVRQGVSLTMLVGTHFQFRKTGNIPLQFIIVTMPPWPDADEAVELDEGHWSISS